MSVKVYCLFLWEKSDGSHNMELFLLTKKDRSKSNRSKQKINFMTVHQYNATSDSNQQDIAAEIKNILCERADKTHFCQSFSAIDFSYANSTLRLTFPHEILKTWFMDNHAQTLLETVKSYENITHIDYFISKTQNTKTFSFPSTNGKNDTYEQSFANFLTNDKNNFPFTLCKSITEQNNFEYNPIILYGKHGHGKTHLLSAMHHKFTTKALSGFYGNVHELNKLFCKARTDNFTSTCNKFDFFLLDDFHTVANYNELQNELISLFDFFKTKPKPMVFASSVKINDCSQLLPQLKSRLLGGLLLSLKKPDLDIKLRFVKRECRRHGLELSEEQILYLVRQFHDFRSLEGSLLKTLAYKQFITPDISLNRLQKIVEDSSDKNKPPSAKMIINATCDRYQISLEDICSPKRKKEISFTRQIAMYLCRKQLGISFPQIGSLFGNKNHTTVMYSIQKIEHKLKKEPELKKELEIIYEKAKKQRE